jgi:hypothetical protein
MIDKAMQDVAAATFIRDTVDGKPSNGDASAGSANVEIRIVLVGQ